MKKSLPLLLFIYSFQFLSAQSAFDLVYEVFENKCNSCHNNSNPLGNLDLEGSGSNIIQKKLKVYSNLVNVKPFNSFAADEGIDLIEPGRADQSFLFQKINNDFDPWVEWNPQMGHSMPPDDPLTDYEKELIRQWILFGADRTGKEFDEKVIERFYAEGGIKSYSDGPPPAPAADEGFQVRVGPFFLDENGQPNDELEFFSKYALDLDDDMEVNRIDLKLADYSHHLIVYAFGDSKGNNLPNGLRLQADHSDVSLVAAVQEPTDLKLPNGTAFFWDNDLVLDLNAHYINYSPQGIYQAEAYLNVYTQPKGTAAQEMKTSLITNFNIPIPNNGEIITHTDNINPNAGKLFVWGIMGHTHQYGRDYKAYRRVNGFRGDIVYDASCPRGEPGCSSPYYDYRHIPMRYFEPLEPIDFNFANGLIHEAKWENNGPRSVNFGVTSDDEMMVLVMMFTEDTTGIDFSNVANLNQLEGVSVFPNPTQADFQINFPWVDDYSIRMLDLTGKVIFRKEEKNAAVSLIENLDFLEGIYFLEVINSEGKRSITKLVLQKS